jgi:cbb3-type cytochrome oxidase subunit 1
MSGYETLGRVWVGNLAAGVMFVVAFVAWPAALSLIASAPFVPTSIVEYGSLSMYAGIVAAVVVWARVVVGS